MNAFPSTLALTLMAVTWFSALPEMAAGASSPLPTQVQSLDGNDWLLVPDPKDVGRQEKWYQAPQPEAKTTKVPWIIQDAFPGQHGVFWYWRRFTPPANPHAGGRYLLRFWQVDYASEIWLNGKRIGQHEGGEDPFLFDVTATIEPGKENLLAVRVLNPTHTPIDGIVLNETAHRNKALPYGPGSAWDQGGIWDSVELLLTPPVRVSDLFVRPDRKTGVLKIEATLWNASDKPASGELELSVAPAANGTLLDTRILSQELPPGETVLRTELKVDQPHLWQLNDPFLYRVSARVAAQGSTSVDEQSTRVGFRDFRFDRGAFRLNDQRIWLKCSHTGNCCPIGLEMPHDPDLLRRDLLNCKVMGFNAIRFISGVAKRYQLDLCDEIGLMVYEESYAGWCMADSPKFAERYDASVLGMIRRDRNHPSVTIWGLLNETNDGPVFRHAVKFLAKARQLDDSRLILLNSGRWDLGAGGGSIVGLESWRAPGTADPCVTYNPTQNTLRASGVTWTPGQLAFHPGPKGEYSVVRWTAPAAGSITVHAEFTGIAEKATTDVHLLHGQTSLWDGALNLNNAGNTATVEKTLTVQAGDTIDCAVGWGNGGHGGDSTGLKLIIRDASGKTYDAAAELRSEQNPNGPWSYGQSPPGAAPNPGQFQAYSEGTNHRAIGSLCNPGSHEWEDVLHDIHPYKPVPHTAPVIRELRTHDGNGKPVFISEYGIGSAVDLIQVVKRYEQLGKADVEDAQFYRQQRDHFLVDWHRWHMDELYPRPEDYFAAALAKMAGQRLLGLNALRANPNCVGHSLTGTVDQGMTAEGLTTTFREFKPGTLDAIADAFAPLRWCLFVESLNVYRGTKVHVEAVLANEDALKPGDYPVRFEVVGPDLKPVFQKEMTFHIPEPEAGKDLPFVLPVLAEDVVIDGPTGTYQFLASFLQKAGDVGGKTAFFVADPADMPAIEPEVVLWGDDAELADWLKSHGIRTRAPGAEPKARELILVGRKVQADPQTFGDLARRIGRGSTAVFLCPEVFRKGDQSMGWAPLAQKGECKPCNSWLYLKDEWAKRHAIFAGLPAGGLLDLSYYREVIPVHLFLGQDPPAEAVAGAINAAQGYYSGLMVAVYPLGSGRFVLNTLNIRDNLGQHPAAERLLRNLLQYAAQNAQEPLEELPADFNEQLTSFGYDKP